MPGCVPLGVPWGHRLVLEPCRWGTARAPSGGGCDVALRVLYIGGTGQISFDCVHQSVAAGHDVSVFNRGNTGSGLPDAARRLTGDVDDPAAYGALANQGFDVVCQFRAFTPADVERDVALFGGRIAQYVFISSASAYEKPPRRNVVTEDVPLDNPFWEYSRLKAAAEAVLTAQSGQPYTIVRPSHTLRTRLPTAFSETDLAPRRMLAGRPIIVPGDGTSVWTTTRSADFAPPFVRLLGNDLAIGEAFHLTADHGFTWNQIYQAIGHAVGAVPDLVHVATDTLVRYNADWLGPLTGDKVNSMLFDNTKIKAVVGDFTCASELAEVLRRPLAGFRNAAPADPEQRRLDVLFDRIAADQRQLGAT